MSKNRLRKLDQLPAPDLWDEILQRDPERRSEHQEAMPRDGAGPRDGFRRLITAVVALSIFAAAGAFAWVALGRSAGPTPAGPAEEAQEEAPNVAQVLCTKEGDTRLLTPAVRPVESGFRFTVENSGPADEVFIRDAVSASNWAADIDLSSSLEWTFALPPGDALIGCFRNSAGSVFDIPVDRYVPIQLIDPEGHWVSTDLACGDGTESTILGEAWDRSSETVDQFVRRMVLGVVGTDVVEPAGYPAENESVFRVVREGDVIALLRVLPADGEPRTIHLDACRRTGIGKASTLQVQLEQLAKLRRFFSAERTRLFERLGDLGTGGYTKEELAEREAILRQMYALQVRISELRAQERQLTG